MSIIESVAAYLNAGMSEDQRVEHFYHDQSDTHTFTVFWKQYRWYSVTVDNQGKLQTSVHSKHLRFEDRIALDNLIVQSPQ